VFTQISNNLELEGWQLMRTLQCLKIYEFDNIYDMSGFSLKILSMKCSSKIEISVTPNEFTKIVEVSIISENNCQKKVKKIIKNIEDIYNYYKNTKLV